MAFGHSAWMYRMISEMFDLYSSSGTCWDRLGMAEGRTLSFAPYVSHPQRPNIPDHRVTRPGSRPDSWHCAWISGKTRFILSSALSGTSRTSWCCILNVSMVQRRTYHSRRHWRQASREFGTSWQGACTESTEGICCWKDRSLESVSLPGR